MREEQKPIIGLSKQNLNLHIVPVDPGVWPLLFEGYSAGKVIGQYTFYSVVDNNGKQIVVAMSNDGNHTSQMPPLHLVRHKLEAIEPSRHSASELSSLAWHLGRHEGVMLSWSDDDYQTLYLLPYLQVPAQRLLSQLVVRAIDIYDVRPEVAEKIEMESRYHQVIHFKHIRKDKRLIMLVVCLRSDTLIRLASDLQFDVERQQLRPAPRVQPYVVTGKS